MTHYSGILVHVTVNMDMIDKNLIAMLHANSRTSTSDLARKVGVSRSTVQGRIDRLCRNGVIARFTIEEGGEYDMIAVVAAESTERLNQLLDYIATLPGIVRTNSSAILATKLRR